MLITIGDIKKKVGRIAKTAIEDPEAAHYMEDELYYQVLSHIVETDLTTGEIQRLIRAILKTKELDFPRWG